MEGVWGRVETLETVYRQESVPTNIINTISLSILSTLSTLSRYPYPLIVSRTSCKLPFETTVSRLLGPPAGTPRQGAATAQRRKQGHFVTRPEGRHRLNLAKFAPAGDCRRAGHHWYQHRPPDGGVTTREGGI